LKYTTRKEALRAILNLNLKRANQSKHVSAIVEYQNFLDIRFADKKRKENYGGIMNTTLGAGFMAQPNNGGNPFLF
jgi:hypothetical protein